MLKSSKQHCGDCPIRYQAVCSRCDNSELGKLEKIKSYKTFEKNESIYFQGQRLTHVGTIVSGVASLSRSLEDGRRQVLGILLPGDFIGRPGRRVSDYDIVASADVMICKFEIGAFEEILDASPALGPRLLEISMDELDVARSWMLLLGRKSAREKVASLIYMISSKLNQLQEITKTENFEFDLPLTREQIADHLGLTTETVSRHITALKNSEVIIPRGQRHITIPSFSSLLEETGDDYSGDVIV